jgi:hypothetical protein
MQDEKVNRILHSTTQKQQQHAASIIHFKK